MRRGAMNVEASLASSTSIVTHISSCHLSLSHSTALQLAMSANKPDQVSTPTDSNGPTPASSRLDLTIVPATPSRSGSNLPSRSGTGESTRLLATKHPKYWGGDVTDSDPEENRGRGGASSRRAGGRDGELRWRAEGRNVLGPGVRCDMQCDGARHGTSPRERIAQTTAHTQNQRLQHSDSRRRPEWPRRSGSGQSIMSPCVWRQASRRQTLMDRSPSGYRHTTGPCKSLRRP